MQISKNKEIRKVEKLNSRAKQLAWNSVRERTAVIVNQIY